ncbi:hypothetical protein [Spiroplasma endosymbiont of Zeiraphera isertana]|uniref:hypothetical protein n=1 Tax=Spiroplasma endosymbiont of Zeiraphera isertana TaxID=3066313 RepID=UPI00313CDE18
MIIIEIENPIAIKSPKINPTINIVLTPDVNEVWSYFVKLLKITLLAVAKIIVIITLQIILIIFVMNPILAPIDLVQN